MADRGLFLELRKWMVAAWRTFDRSESGKWLWILAALSSSALVGAALLYQWAGAQLAVHPALRPSDGLLKPLGDRESLAAFAVSAFGVVSTLSLAFLTVVGSVLAALLVTLVAKIQHEVALLDQALALLLLAGQGGRLSRSLDLRIAIVVPRYLYDLPKLPPTKTKEDRTFLVDVGGRTIQWTPPLTFNDRHDSRAAQIIHAKLTEIGFRRVDILDDKESQSALNAYDCEILVGLCVNSRVNELLESATPPKIFAIPKLRNGHYGLCLARTGPGGIITNANTLHPTYSDRPDETLLHMLIAKHVLLGRAKIVVGGLSGRGTQLCAQYFCANLRGLARFRDASHGIEIRERQFGIVLACDTTVQNGLALQETRIE